MNATQDEQEMILCRSCGMCCRGAFFVSIKISEDEISPLNQTTRLKPYSRKNKLYSPQPSPELGPSGCLIYDRRPIDCKNYECQLLDCLKSGIKSLDECLSDVYLLQNKYDEVCSFMLRQDSASSIDVFNLRFELARFLTSSMAHIQSNNNLDSLPAREHFILIYDYLKVVNDKFRLTKFLPKMTELMALLWIKRLR